MSILTNANFRSLYVWSLEEAKHRRPGMNYGAIQSLPVEMRTFIEDERRRHASHFDIKILEFPPEERPPKFNPQLWMRIVRRSFSRAIAQAFKKAQEVS
jgi:hypothetical protein